jgi:hypothetical protein
MGAAPGLGQPRNNDACLCPIRPPGRGHRPTRPAPAPPTDQPGVPRKGNALLQGIVSCGRCSRRMCLRYSGPHGDYPVYMCVADHSADGEPRCQEVRALIVDAEVERVILTALRPDQIALAIAALAEVEQESHLLERQWSLKRERARYDAERARQQYKPVDVFRIGGPICAPNRQSHDWRTRPPCARSSS